MGNFFVTTMSVPSVGCSQFVQALLMDGFRFREPFELKDSEAAVLITSDEMADISFILSFSAVSPSSPDRIVTIDWWRLRGPEGRRRAEQIISRIEKAAVAQGGTLLHEPLLKRTPPLDVSGPSRVNGRLV